MHSSCTTLIHTPIEPHKNFVECALRYAKSRASTALTSARRFRTGLFGMHFANTAEDKHATYLKSLEKDRAQDYCRHHVDNATDDNGTSGGYHVKRGSRKGNRDTNSILMAFEGSGSFWDLRYKPKINTIPSEYALHIKQTAKRAVEAIFIAPIRDLVTSPYFRPAPAV